MEEKNALIYGVKSENEIHYIGKTNKKGIGVNGIINKSKIHAQYTNPPLRDIFQNYENISIEPIIFVPEKEWYPEKNKEVVKHAAEKHPLLNAQWMIDGKNGYWQGKKRDAHTLQMLSQSKYKQFVEYDKNGKFKNLWKSGKEIGNKIFGDYRVKNGGGSTKLYERTSKGNSIKRRFAHNSYWFKLEELILHFNGIPEKLNITYMIKKEEEEKKLRRALTNKKKTKIRRYIVELYERSTDELITMYKNSEEAGYKLKLGVETIRRLCSNTIRPAADFILRYGKKTLQSKNIQFPKYQTKPLKRIPIDYETIKTEKWALKQAEKEKQKREAEQKTLEELQHYVEERNRKLKNNEAINICICELDYELSIRALNCLRSTKIETLKELVQYDRKKLLYIKNMGIKTVDEIETFLKKYGLSLL